MYCSINSSEKEGYSRDMHQSTQITKFKHSYIIKYDIDFAYEMLLKWLIKAICITKEKILMTFCRMADDYLRTVKNIHSDRWM